MPVLTAYIVRRVTTLSDLNRTLEQGIQFSSSTHFRYPVRNLPK